MKRTRVRRLQTTNPASTSPAFHFITTRLIDSFDLPDGVAKYYEWMNLPTGDEFFVHGTSRRTIEWLDAVHPRDDRCRAPVSARCGAACTPPIPQDLGQNHQVLAYGYTDAGTTSTLRLYDCNHPDDDGVTITFDHSDPHHSTKFSYSYDDHTVIGFFPSQYTPKDPSPLFQQ